jgi:CRISPR system Cascade subunit CasB
MPAEDAFGQSERSGLVTNPTVTPFQRQAAEFIAALERLDAGGLARLKRNAGNTLADARDVHRAFFQSLPYTVGERLHEDYFLIATLFPLADNHENAGNFGDSMRRVKLARGGGDSGRANSLDRRFEALLDCEREQLGFRLRQAVRLVAASDQTIDWTQFLLDIIGWDHSERRTQLRWARSYFIGKMDASTTE